MKPERRLIICEVNGSKVVHESHSEQQIRVPLLLIRPRQQARPLLVFDFVGCAGVLVGYAGFLWEGSVAADFAYEFFVEFGAHRELAE